MVAALAGATRCEIHVGDDLEILPRFPEPYFDWVYLDSSHQYEHTLAELELLDTRINPGGLIAGHDWIEDPRSVNHGTCKAIREFCSKRDWTVAHLDAFTQWELRRG